jgi:hypothetical protein
LTAGLYCVGLSSALAQFTSSVRKNLMKQVTGEMF